MTSSFILQEKLEKVWQHTKELEVAYIQEKLGKNRNIDRIISIIQDVPLYNIWNTLELNEVSFILLNCIIFSSIN